MSDVIVGSPLIEALGSSYMDRGGAGQSPPDLERGLELNGLVQTAHTTAPVQDNGFDAVLKSSPTTAPAVAPFKLG